MTVFEALILGALQGITEFLPISSSGHLVLGEELLGLHMPELKSFDIAVHMGTLIAILAYFWKDFLKILISAPGLKKLQIGNFSPGAEYRKQLTYILIGTIPAVLAAVFFEDRIDMLFRSAKMVAIMMIAVGAVFSLAEFVNKKIRKSELNWWKSLIIGIAQAIALIPGVSRSGSTIVAGLFQGIEREKAARFSFLLGAPAIFGAGLWTTVNGNLGEIEFLPTLVGFASSGIVGFAAVWLLMKFLKKHTLNIFAVYRIVAGVLFLCANL